MDYRIAIVNSSSFGQYFPEHLDRLKAMGEVVRVRVSGDAHGRELAEALKGFNVVIASVTPFFDAEFFEAKRDLLLLSRHGIGFNNVDVVAACAAGTLVTTVPPKVERDAVAEGAVATLMDIMRRVSDSHVAANEGRWADRASFIGSGLSGKTLGIVGCGNIGSRIVEILSRGFDMRVLACDPVQHEMWADVLGVEYVDIDTVVSQCDVLTLNADLNPSSFHIIGERELSLMKKGVYVVDNARADLIDQQAMLRALDDGTVAGLAIDVMHDEPPALDDPYFNHPKVLVTTHISAYTAECLYGMGEKCVGDVERYVRGEAPVNAKD
ncbi:D-isomer specific 2-hydroxyacid dehydrogenase family protein [uncultured Olsenella sp.]|uniref:D-isomer specific 2-hydroxyacid dehydrogenase family protein n=1 Tax=uncultured Olsenella sp. TaxID=190764 RepID=UPI0026DD1416|nr:D-isomer specific 2-hydroxyacid dehydrogenase family protein [uncultured Olsenella sp.]